jgi:RsiW-degrading membrane proteinase PrsW (M82 family)
LFYLLGIIVLGSIILVSNVITYRKKPKQESLFLILIPLFYALIAIVLLILLIMAIAASAHT